MYIINSLGSRRSRRHFVADDIFKCIFLNENVLISIKISVKFISKVPINNIPALVRIMVWCRSGDKPLSEPITIILLAHVCVTRHHWVNCGNNLAVSIGQQTICSIEYIHDLSYYMTSQNHNGSNITSTQLHFTRYFPLFHMIPQVLFFYAVFDRLFVDLAQFEFLFGAEKGWHYFPSSWV